MKRLYYILIIIQLVTSCKAQQETVIPGAEQLDKFLPEITGKRLAIVANHTSMIGNTHLIDTLLTYADVNIIKIFAPEHGFRGREDAGAEINDLVDQKTGLPIISLYGKNKKPGKEQLENIDMLVFDIQDIGVRFFTYISTLYYVMASCAENHVPLLILDRPNPNGNYVDGPVLKEKYKSFVGMLPVPVVHGLTIGELAGMINGEKWLENELHCDISVIPCLNYQHHMNIVLASAPSPNLPTNHSLRIYPSTCFFEGTAISEGRGTYNPFEVYGHPKLTGEYTFIPRSIEGMSLHPKYMNIECVGEDLRNYSPENGWCSIELKWLLDAYQKFPDKEEFFIPYFDKLAGTDSLRKQIESGWNEDRIKESWQKDLKEYKHLRSKYLLYEL